MTEEIKCINCKSEDIACTSYDDRSLIENYKCRNCKIKFQIEYELKVTSIEIID